MSQQEIVLAQAAGESRAEVLKTYDQAYPRQSYECPDIECGAVFSYRRVSLGRFVAPNFCPMCGGPMEAEGVTLIGLTAEFSGESGDRLEPGAKQFLKLPG